MDMTMVVKAPATQVNNAAPAVNPARKSSVNANAGDKSANKFGQALEAAKERTGNETANNTGTAEQDTQGLSDNGTASLAANANTDFIMAAIQSFFTLPLPVVADQQAVAAETVTTPSDVIMGIGGLTASSAEGSGAKGLLGQPQASTEPLVLVGSSTVDANAAIGDGSKLNADQQSGTKSNFAEKVETAAILAADDLKKQPTANVSEKVSVKSEMVLGMSAKGPVAPVQSAGINVKAAQQETIAPVVFDAGLTVLSQINRQAANNGEAFMQNDQLTGMMQQQPEQISQNAADSSFAGILTGMDQPAKLDPVAGKENNAQLPAQPVNDPDNVIGQIVENARLISRQTNSEMVIRLKPEHLGDMTLKITVEGGVVSAAFHSNNSEVRSVIEASLPQLKQDLFNQGLKVDNVGVYAGLGQFLSNDRRETPQQQPVVKFNTKKTDEDFVQAVEQQSTTHTGTAGDGAGVDYRI